MKSFYYGLLLSILSLPTGFFESKAQNIAFEEDFESNPITSMWNSLDDTLWTGSSWCGQAARGMSSHHNSTDVDFLNAQNSSYFLANNPQDSCGGFNFATVESDSFDLSSYDSLFFSCRYFLGDSIGWGNQNLTFDLMTSSDTFTIDTVFSDTSQWSSVDLQLPGSMIDDTVSFEIEMGGGEAVGVDDIMIYEPVSTSVKADPAKEEKLNVHPNPVKERLIIEDPALKKEGTRIRLLDLTGKEVRKLAPSTSARTTWEVSELRKGIYIFELRTEGGVKRYRRIVKR